MHMQTFVSYFGFPFENGGVKVMFAKISVYTQTLVNAWVEPKPTPCSKKQEVTLWDF